MVSRQWSLTAYVQTKGTFLPFCETEITTLVKIGDGTNLNAD